MKIILIENYKVVFGREMLIFYKAFVMMKGE